MCNVIVTKFVDGMERVFKTTISKLKGHKSSLSHPKVLLVCQIDFCLRSVKPC